MNCTVKDLPPKKGNIRISDENKSTPISRFYFIDCNFQGNRNERSQALIHSLFILSIINDAHILRLTKVLFYSYGRTYFKRSL